MPEDPAVAAVRFTHTIAINSCDHTAMETWFELGFGVDQVKGVQALPARASDAARSTASLVREAQIGDLEALVERAREITRFHAESPMFRPALSDHEFVRDELTRAMASDHHKVVVAEADDGITGFLQVNPDPRFADTATIGIAGVARSDRHRGVGTAIVNYTLGWAGRSGFRFCAVEWTSSNLTSDRFWRNRGFQPLQYKLTRRIDPRIAWADSEISYEYIRPVEL
jgi:GNAT superfamily N-acetyltransferase